MDTPISSLSINDLQLHRLITSIRADDARADLEAANVELLRREIHTRFPDATSLITYIENRPQEGRDEEYLVPLELTDADGNDVADNDTLMEWLMQPAAPYTVDPLKEIFEGLTGDLSSVDSVVIDFTDATVDIDR